MLEDLPGPVDHAVRLLIARGAACAFLVVGAGAGLTEVVSAWSDHGVHEGLAADEARARQVIFYMAYGVLLLFVAIALVRPGIHRNVVGIVIVAKRLLDFLEFALFVVLLFFPLFFQLPPRLIVRAVMQKLAGVSEATEACLFIVLE